jgi:hypothetical protein
MTGESGGFARIVKNAQGVAWLVTNVLTLTGGMVFVYVSIMNQLDEHGGAIARIQEIQQFQLKNDSWQNEALEHITQKHPGEPPRRPDELRGRLVELLSR